MGEGRWLTVNVRWVERGVLRGNGVIVDLDDGFVSAKARALSHLRAIHPTATFTQIDHFECTVAGHPV